MKRIFAPILLCACLLLTGALLLRASAATSQTTPPSTDSPLDTPLYNLELLSQAGGSVGSFVIAEPYVYTMIGPRLTVLQFDGGASPSVVWQSEVTTATLSGLTLHMNALYAGTSQDDLLIFDISDPQHPSLAGRLELPAPAGLTIINDSFAYLSFNLGDTYLLDISDPLHPQLEEIVPGVSPSGGQINGQYLYQVNWNVLNILNVSDPLHPTLVTSYTNSIGIESFAVEGDYAYLQWLDYVPGPSGNVWFGNLRILDVSSLPAISDTFLIEGYPGLPSQLRSMELLDGKLYGYDIVCGHATTPCSEYLNSVDVSNPLSPTLELQHLYFIEHEMFGFRQVGVSPGKVYASTYDQLLRFDPQSSSLLDGFHSWSGGQVGVENQRAFVNADGYGIVTVDISDPTQPQVSGIYTPSLIYIPNRAYVGQLALYGPYAYALVKGVNLGTWHIETLDLARPDDIQRSAWFTDFLMAPETIHHGYLYGNDYQDYETFQILDLGDPVGPLVASQLPSSSMVAFALHGHHLYGRRYASDSIQIYDIANPSDPELVGSFDVIGAGDHFAAGAGVLYIATAEEVLCYDLADPDDPDLAGSIPLGESQVLEQMHAEGERLVLVLNKEVRVLQLNDPSQPPVELAALELPAYDITGVEMDGDLIYLTGWRYGLLVLRLARNLPELEQQVYLPTVFAQAWTLPADYSIAYQVYLQDQGWQPWTVDGGEAGLPGGGLRVEALRLRLGRAHPGDMDIAYHAHVQEIGWMDWVYTGELAGTVGLSRRLEALRLRLINPPQGAVLTYQVYVQDLGWQDVAAEGEIAGTVGQFRRIEAVRINLSP
jgi:hypothetical protein